MQKYDTLYARTNTGAVQLWWMEREGNAYRSCYGQKGGVITETEWTIAEPKNVGKRNETDGSEQAHLEVLAKYKKQLKSEGYFENEADIDKQKYFQVMLAKDYADYKDKLDWKAGVGVQIKYNGGRVVATKDGLFTRKGEKYVSIPHIEEALKPFFAKFPNAILDGEGFNYELREKLNEIMKLLRKTVHVTPEDLKRSKELIRFYIYDGYGIPFKGRGFNIVTSATDDYLVRKYAIDNAFFAPCFKERWKDVIGFVPTWTVHSEKELEVIYQKFLDDRQEGAILRSLTSPYENKRSKFLLKYKPVDDAEFRVLDIEEGTADWSGVAKRILVQRIDGQKFKDGTDTFHATFKGTWEEADKCLKQKAKYIGKVVTIYYNGLTGYGKPNYAQFDINNFDKGH
jgi:DNA ligase 1